MRTTRTRCLGAVVLVSVALAAAAEAQSLPSSQAGFDATRLARIDELAREYVENGHMPGLRIVIQRNGRIVRDVITGFRDTEAKAPLTSDTIFRIYSMTKPVTGVAIMQLVERGLVGLHDPVARFLPGFADLAVWGDQTDSRAGASMTVWHLLTHTSGLTYDDSSADGVPALYAGADLYSGPDLDSFVRRLEQLPLASAPGTRWEYSVGMDVLGRIVEVASGDAFDTYLSENVFDPLGMEDTGFRVPDEKIFRFAALYRRDREGGLRLIESPTESGYRASRPTPFGGHGLVSTAADYMRFGQMLVEGGSLDGVRILTSASVDLLTRDHLAGKLDPDPLVRSWLGATARGLGFGLAGAVVRDGVANGVPGSDGVFFWGGAASTFFWVDRARQIVGLQFTQLMPSDAYPIREELRELTYAALVDPASAAAR